jgi:hypothetical protein
MMKKLSIAIALAAAFAASTIEIKAPHHSSVVANRQALEQQIAPHIAQFKPEIRHELEERMIASILSSQTQCQGSVSFIPAAEASIKCYAGLTGYSNCSFMYCLDQGGNIEEVNYYGNCPQNNVLHYASS